ncbi:hypothetical protein AU184_26325 [Mycolicibacterium novocastrense]|nr:hypothetical protein AU183_00060 [Mycolicibacterium novocastrense]KUH68189.1 hypothetical protein AU184_26325 [Mycolicibacterium novocastrense]KUH74398.1 hypothetical protein AU072_17415 [Mycolicibacterium novocastrense]
MINQSQYSRSRHYLAVDQCPEREIAEKQITEIRFRIRAMNLASRRGHSQDLRKDHPGSVGKLLLQSRTQSRIFRRLECHGA